MSLRGSLRGILLFVVMAGVAHGQAATEADKLRGDAEAAYQQGDFAKCIQITSQLITANPKDHGAYYLRASSQVELGVVRRDGKSIRQGVEDARESLKIGGSGEINYYLPYMYGMTALANLENRKEHADVVLQVAQSVLVRPMLPPEQKANILYQRAAAYIHMKNIDGAIQDYEAAIKAFPGHLGSHVGLAESYVVSQKGDKALAAFSSAVETFPNDPLVYNNRGLFLQQQKRLNDALTDFNKALQLDPKFAVAHTNRAYTQQVAGNLIAAEADYSEAIKLQPNNPLFHSLRGTCRLAQGNTTTAIEDYNQAIKLVPQNPVAHADLAFAKYFSKDFAGAIASFDQAVNLDANMRYLNPWRIWTLVQLTKTDAMAPIVEATTKKTEKDLDWIDELVLFISGKKSEQDLINGVNKVKDANLKNAQLCEAYYFIAERRSHDGDKQNATTFYQEVLKTKAVQLSAHRGAQFVLNSFSPGK